MTATHHPRSRALRIAAIEPPPPSCRSDGEEPRMHVRNLTVAARVRGFFHSLAAHRWAAPCARLAAFGVGLVILAAIGRAASAGPPLQAEPQLMSIEAASVSIPSDAGSS